MFVLHLGKSRKCDMAKELAELAKPWFRAADIFTESVETLRITWYTGQGNGERAHLFGLGLTTYF